MTKRIRWETAYRIIPSRYPVVGIFDDVADPRDLEIVIELAAATNPRVLDEAGELPLVRPADRVSGPGTTPVMAAFTHTRPSRFSDGSYGVYYAAADESTAIAESGYHRARFLRDAALPDERLDMRVYTARITGRYDDLRARPLGDPIYDPASYAISQAHALPLYTADELDGIVATSVRRPAGQCVAAFRPRRIHDCATLHHLEYRFANYELAAVVNIEARESG
jgi:hypothetical protein